VLFASVLTLAACGGDDNADEPADTGDDAATEETTEGDGGTVDSAAGEEVYAQSCAACHGADLTGGAGPDLSNIGSKYSAEELADIVTNGIGSMPAQNVSGEDLDNLVNWLAEKK
ncbi:MAG TPA: cytochrome c, partial [Bacillota bacterium]|nr:cytochrome c [Bacillota bacterium]